MHSRRRHRSVPSRPAGYGPSGPDRHLIVTTSITSEAARELGLTEGSEVVAMIKASDVMVAVPD